MYKPVLEVFDAQLIPQVPFYPAGFAVEITLDGIGTMLLLLPVSCIILGGLIGHFLSRRDKDHGMSSRSGAIYAGLGLLVLTSAVANSAQTMYDLGLTIRAIYIVAALALFAGSAALVHVWRTLYPQRARWFLLLPGGVLLLQPLLTAFTLTVWSLNGFAP